MIMKALRRHNFKWEEARKGVKDAKWKSTTYLIHP